MSASLNIVRTIESEARLILALMLRDIKTRFGGSELGFLVAVAWPLSHIVVLLLIWGAAGRVPPYGDSSALWFSTGIVPYMAFQYVSRFLLTAILENRPMLFFPIVKVPDILFARAIIEVLNAALVAIIVLLLLWTIGVDFMPLYPVQAALAMLSMTLLGLGFGIINAILAGVVRFWIIAYAVLQIALWLASGIVFVPDALPDIARIPLSYLPTVQGVEWMRSAYYVGYGSNFLDKPYMMSCAVVMVFLGLLTERVVRGKLGI